MKINPTAPTVLGASNNATPAGNSIPSESSGLPVANSNQTIAQAEVTTLGSAPNQGTMMANGVQANEPGTPPPQVTQQVEVTPPTDQKAPKDAGTELSSESSTSSGSKGTDQGAKTFTPPKVVRKVDNKVDEDDSDDSKPAAKEDAVSDDSKPAAKEDDQSDDESDKKPAAQKKPPSTKHALATDDSETEDDSDDELIDKLISTGAIPGPSRASMPVGRGRGRGAVNQTWAPGPNRDERSKKRSQEQPTHSNKKAKKARTKKHKSSKPQPVPKNQTDALAMLKGKDTAIKGLNTKLKDTSRDLELSDRMVFLSGKAVEMLVDGDQQINFAYQIYRLIREELTCADEDSLNVDDIYSIGGLLEGFSNGLTMADMEEMYQKEKKDETD
jgi:hypothetical protein